MSRWTSYGADRGKNTENDDEKAAAVGKNSLLDRRGFLQTAGAGIAAAAGFAGSAAAAEYRTITLSPGETRTMRVSDGETFENTLFDISASGAVARLIIDGANATVRNVAWSGAQDTESYAVFALGNATAGNTLIENIYMGDGSTTGASAGQRDPTAIWADGGASGDVTIRNVNVQDWGDNGMYLSSASDLDVTIEGCYAANNPNAEYRLEGGTVRDSVARNAYARGVWGFGPGTTTVENCHIHAPGQSPFWAGEASAGGATIDVSNTEFVGDVSDPHGTVNLLSGNGNDPQDIYPQGCPTSAVEAASGGGSGGSSGGGSSGGGSTGGDSTDGGSSGDGSSGSDDSGNDGDGDGSSDGGDGTLESELRVETPDGGDLVRYEVTTTGRIEPGDEAEGSDRISQNGDGAYTVSGVCGDGYADTFTFRGEVTDHSVSGGTATILVDGESITQQATRRSLRVQTPDDGDVVRYEVTTTGEITPGDEAEWTDRVSRNGDGTWTVAGVCGDGYADTFTFRGEVTDHSISGGPATIFVDGEEYASVDDGPSTMRVQTPDDGDVVHYEVTGTGEIAAGDRAEWTDRISENGDGTWTLSGVCGDGYADTFEVRGTVESFDYSGGEATLYVDGTAVQP